MAKSKPTRYTDADKAAALEVLKAEGLSAAARASGASKSTVIRWARSAGLDPSDYADRSTEQNERAAAAAVVARRAKMLERRGEVSDLLLGQLAPKAASIILDRLEEDAELTTRLRDAEEKLALAIIGLEAAGSPPADASLAELERYVEARKQAREAVRDAMLVRRAWASSRIDVRTLVGVLTRAIGDHLGLEGELDEAHAGTGSFTVVLTAPRPERTPGPTPDVVTLPPEGAHP